MNQHEGIALLQTIQEVYPKYDLSKRKAGMLLKALQDMDYMLVMERLSSHVASHPYPPTIEEIAAYATDENKALHQIQAWREEAAMVPADVKVSFYRKMNALLSKKQAGADAASSRALSAQGLGKEDRHDSDH